jgi:hypothetical protein
MGVRVGRVASKKLKQTPQNVKSKKAKRRSTLFKSASWYANAALSIGASAKAETSVH